MRIGGTLMRTVVTGFVACASCIVLVASSVAGPPQAPARVRSGEALGLSGIFMGVIVATIQGGLVGRLAKKFGERTLVAAGTASYTLGLALFTTIHPLF